MNQVYVRNNIRWMIANDLETLCDIEKASRKKPWLLNDFKLTLSNRNVIGMVVERGETLLGFMVYSLEKTSINIMRMTVDPKFRRTGVGRLMIEKLIAKVTPLKRTKLLVNIPEKKLDVQLFLKACGLKAYGIKKTSKCNYYKFKYSVENPLKNRITDFV